MAEASSKPRSNPSDAQDPEKLERLKKDLEAYREVMLPINKVIEWEQTYYPVILVAAITLIFSIIWYLEPSVLTTVCLLGLLICALDLALPAISEKFLRPVEWTVVQERQFEAICQRILNAKTHITNAKEYLIQLKRNKPKPFLLMMMAAFAVLAWFGSLIDNLLLTYLIVVWFVLVPGLRKHGILQKVTAFIKEKVSALRKTQEKAKTN